MKKLIYTFLFFVAPILYATAQVCEVTFEDDDYAAIGVYDAWENSPFRNGTLQGNVAVIANPHTEVNDILGIAPNASERVLAVQRSRYGSNQFGARIDLKTPFSLTPATQYVHVMVHRPVSGRVMLIGLGKHREADWEGQSAETEQFWVISNNNVTPGQWVDAVFPIKGVSGVDIYSLVLVPECESTHDHTEDFIAYIDQIVVNNSNVPIIQYDEYPVSFDKGTETASRTDRGILSVGLQGVSTLTITSSPTTSDPLYRDRMDVSFAVTPGQTVKPVIGYKGSWMCGYAYVDYGQDGKFSYDINSDGTPSEGSDLVSYSAYKQRNSAGQTLSNNNTLTFPNFTIPSDTPLGFYRMRFKVDWDEIDPAGAETIKDNGGGVIDVRLNVHADNVNVTEDNRNGEILNADGTSLVSTTPFGQSLTIKLNPENGFAYNGVRIRHGYNLTGDSLLHSTPQYVDEYVYRDQFNENDEYTIPAEWVDGDLIIEGLFVEKGTEMEFNYPINYPKTTVIARDDRHLDGVTMAGTTVAIAYDKLLYHEDMTKTFIAVPGQSLTAQFSYTGSWMNGYVYIDRDQDGEFSYDLNSNGTPAVGSDLIAYSHIEGKNSLGSTVAGNTLNPPTFTLPDLQDGFYRIRFKVDWSSADPGGNTSSKNPITNNGGGIADYRLRVFSGSEVNLTNEEVAHGTLVAADGSALPETIAFNAPLTIKAVPIPGFRIGSLEVIHGDLQAEKDVIHSVPQRITTTYLTKDFYDNAISIPATIVDGDLILRATFVRDDDFIPETATLTAESAEGGSVVYFNGEALTEPLSVPQDQPATILVFNDERYAIEGLQIVSSNGQSADVSAASFNLNRYDIPASFFADNGQVVVTPIFSLLPETESRAWQRWSYVWGDEFESEEYAKPSDARWVTPTRSHAVWARFIADNDSTSFIRDGYYVARTIANPDRESDDIAMLSGAIQSSGRFAFQYGRVEARIKTTRHRGNFPAFWMMPQDNSAGWPKAGEIDIWETIDNQNTAYHTIHSNWSYNAGGANNPKNSGNESVTVGDWHIYAAEWDSTQIRWFVDGRQVFSYKKKSGDSNALSNGQWPFDAPFYVILNQSVGNGSWAAAADESFTYQTLFDYVRVYQIGEAGSDNASYSTNYPKSAAVSHATRRLSAVGFNNTMVNVPNSSVWYNYIDEPILTIVPGEELQPNIDYSEDWMHGYVYLDLDNDSTFQVLAPSQGILPNLSELMSYSYYKENSNDAVGYNSKGVSLSNNNTMNMPPFTIPETITPGIYRVRFKVDWNSIDAGGSTVPGNTVMANGGAICDVNILVQDPTGLDTIPLSSAYLRTDWYDLQGRRINAPTTPGVYILGNKKVWVKNVQ